MNTHAETFWFAAIHEACHAVIQALLKADVAEVVINADGSGYVDSDCYAIHLDVNEAATVRYFNDAVISAAGPLAVERARVGTDYQLEAGSNDSDFRDIACVWDVLQDTWHGSYESYFNAVHSKAASLLNSH